VPEDAPLGYQVAVLRQGDKTATYPFVISPKSAKANTIAVIASTNTWQSYNNWGEASHYESQIGEGCLNTDYARIISTQRPVGFADLLAETPFGDHLFMAEKRLAEWLDKNKMTYAVYTDDDLHENPKLLEEYKTVMLTPHPEYFTKEMFDSLEKHVKKGGNIINLGGNALYYRVTRQGNQIEKHENGRLHDLDKQFGGTWAGYLGRSPASLLGVEFDARDYGTFAPMTVVNAQHPLFKGTGLKNGETFAPNGSGHEMDRLSSWSPASTVLLAEGANPKGFGAHMVLVEHPFWRESIFKRLYLVLLRSRQ
jgi:N,N-dimethylformamidase